MMQNLENGHTDGEPNLSKKVCQISTEVFHDYKGNKLESKAEISPNDILQLAGTRSHTPCTRFKQTEVSN